jgi:hypothetical protein
MVEARPGIAFIDFDNELQSGVALQGLQVSRARSRHMEDGCQQGGQLMLRWAVSQHYTLRNRKR